MALGFGLLGLAPAAFWGMTPKELEAALRGKLGRAAFEGPPTRVELEGMLQLFPDRQPATGIRQPD